MTLEIHNRTALAIARVDVFFGALALAKSPSTRQLLQPVNDNRRMQ